MRIFSEGYGDGEDIYWKARGSTPRLAVRRFSAHEGEAAFPDLERQALRHTLLLMDKK